MIKAASQSEESNKNQEELKGGSQQDTAFSTATTQDGKGGGGSGEDPSSTTTSKTAELLSEATQLLKSLRIQPKLKVMQLSNLDQARDDLILLDSGATHAL